ncbi:hypothetical protein SAMN04487895_101724 [Paenibacillus sophorae]|uniref:Uncharacterized protein n=1 Tax=Paenibacillus sophorae TaxID=1333845 RepID=A0A1H8H137_9BACL|nr:hypothetical protein [Paenibacillus sophorae]QWU14413.1 hypothetical protein KP014_21125 [Paenibacillus sophorae]SEN50062.1 hypothetical protein SAMN04487895_101724 [Paenibacillus sophorae]
MDWQKTAVIISALTFIRLIIKDILDTKAKMKERKEKASKTSRKSPKRKH